MPTPNPKLIEVPILYSTWSELAGRLVESELNANLNDTVVTITDGEKKEIERLIDFLVSTKFYTLSTDDRIGDVWNSWRQSKVVVDIIITATMRFVTMVGSSEVMSEIIENASRSIGVATWSSLADEDFVEHSLTVEDARSVFEENLWFLVAYLASFYLRDKGLS